MEGRAQGHLHHQEGRMTQAEFNKMLQTVQEIELAVGFKILKLTKHYDGARIHEAIWSSPEGRVFTQTHPFTDHAEYEVDLKNYYSIVARDIWK